MLFQDRATIEGTARITRDGYFVADALVAQADNVQEYRADEVGQPPKADGSLYRIGRPASEVFADAALASAAHRPITIGHPGEDVTAANWKRLAVGDIGDEVEQRGKFVRVPVKLMDAAGIAAVKTTHQEFSLGYTADVDMTPTTIGDQAVDGVVRNIRYNHLALVPRARGGSALRIIDERPEHLRDHNQEPAMKIKIGDAEVDATNGEAVRIAVDALNKKLNDGATEATRLNDALTTANTTVQTRDGEIVALKQQLKDAEVTPAKLQDMADARAKVLTDAKAIAGDKLGDVAGKTDAEIRKAALASTAIGDAALAMSDAAIEGAFAAFAVGAAPTKQTTAANGNVAMNDGDEAWGDHVFKSARVAVKGA